MRIEYVHLLIYISNSYEHQLMFREFIFLIKVQFALKFDINSKLIQSVKECRYYFYSVLLIPFDLG